MAQTHIHLRFAWQAWHSRHSVARLDLVWSPVTPVTPRHFAWQAWHNLTSTFVLRGRRGAISRATLSRTYTYTYTYTYVRTYIHTYVHAYYLFTYFHIQSFTTSFVFPSFPVPATTFEAQYWKKLTCGVIRSLNFLVVAMVAVVPPPQLLDVVWCSAVVVVVVV